MATDTIILGAGIIGLSTAYYLAKHQPPSTIHLVEPSPELFASASGYAGGFLARDWFGPGSASLGALSFDEHKRLAEAHDGAAKWGYQRSTAVSYTAGSQGKNKKEEEEESTRGEDWLLSGTSRAEAAAAAAAGPDVNEDGDDDDDDDDDEDDEDDDDDEVAPPWLRRSAGDSVSVIDTTTAQLDPLRLCHFLLDACLSQGVHLHHPAKAVAVLTDTRSELSSVRMAAASTTTTTETETETDIPCTRLIIAAGAWSPRVFAELFPTSGTKLPISSLAGHSLVVKSSRWAAAAAAAAASMEKEKEKGKKNEVVSCYDCHALFTTSEAGFSPEVFSRAGGEIWIGGLNSDAIPLPEVATERQIEAEAIATVRREASLLLLGPADDDGAVDDDDLEVVREGLCFRPVTPRGTPIISRVEDRHLGVVGSTIRTRAGADGGVFVAAGHGPWGISLSLGTGKVLAEMAQGRKLSADIRSLGMW